MRVRACAYIWCGGSRRSRGRSGFEAAARVGGRRAKEGEKRIAHRGRCISVNEINAD